MITELELTLRTDNGSILKHPVEFYSWARLKNLKKIAANVNWKIIGYKTILK